MSHRFQIVVAILLANVGVLLCQDNPHGNISVPCNTCHSTESWKIELAAIKFDHAKTSFVLTGQHLTLPCRQCHTTLKFSEAPARCASCHGDIHRGELGLACDRCHTPQSWLIADMPRRHAQTRFPLTGMHLNASCEECHVQQQKHQYVGLSIECYSCHKKEYQATVAPAHAASGISTECASCHLVQATTWGGSFDHAQTGFILTGLHGQAACGSCHIANRFRGTPRDCNSCHQNDYTATKNPPHLAAGFGTNCGQCHSASTTTWRGSFNHAQTGFALNGAHGTASCVSCHAGGRFKGTPADCNSCHQNDYTATKNPAHLAAGFPTTCIDCHSANATSWSSTFAHAQTGFALAGAHATATCASCHAGNRFKGTPTDCNSCHQNDYTNTKNPAHLAAGFPTTCIDCHSANATSWSSTFAHAQTGFALAGAHATATCASCHAGNRFKGTPTDCYSCHQNDYTASKNPAHLAAGFPTTCIDCHSANAASWSSTFAHAQTGFALAGAHATATCASCHAGNRFKGTPTDCYSCHQNDYTASKNPAHLAAGFPTTCIDCHSANAASWSSTFAHAQTGFALAGAHATATCASCHGGNRFKGTPTDCYACHQQDYTGASNPVHSSGSFPTTCVTCHSTSAWRPSTFNHTGFFPISAGSSHAPGRWNACSDCHTNATNFAVFSCLTCHEHNQTSMDSKHSGRNGYKYESQACYNCHPRGNGG